MSQETFHGIWRISEVQGMDLDELDNRGEALIRFLSENHGDFVFAFLEGDIDYRLGKRSGHDVLEFSWQGTNDGNEACGRGWVTLKQENLVGKFFIHQGRDYSLVAQLKEKK
ncbi:MAG: hypothetical protein ACKOAD_06875 [Gammaproteobacteria bacterium]